MQKARAFLAVLALCAFGGPAARAGNLPRPAGEFTINLTGGQQIHLSQFKGKVVALMFILTYCPHCQKITTYLIQDQKQYGPRGFQVVESAVEQGAAGNVPGFLKKFNPPFPVGSDTRDPVLAFLARPAGARMLMPQLVFIDRQGMVRAQYSGEEPFFEESQADGNIRAKIEELLKAAPAAAKHSASVHHKS
jgi:thiol-disulfide isomerase/thioredoxin